MTSKQPPASVGNGDGEKLSLKQMAERKAACQQISDNLQASVLGTNVEKNNTKLNSCDSFCREFHSRGLEEWRKTVDRRKWYRVFWASSSLRQGHPPHSAQRKQSPTRPRAEGPRTTAWESGTLEDAGVDFTVGQESKRALLDPLTQTGAKTGIVLLRRDSFENDVVGQIQSSRPLPAADRELEQMRAESHAKGLEFLINVLLVR